MESSNVARTAVEEEELPVAWTTSGSWSHLSRPVRIVAYDRPTLDQVPIADVPVDFSKQMVLIAGMGPTIGHDMGIRITRVWRENSRVRVQEMRLHPGLDRSASVERSSPWTVVVVPRSELPIEGYTSKVPHGVMSN